MNECIFRWGSTSELFIYSLPPHYTHTHTQGNEHLLSAMEASTLLEAAYIMKVMMLVRIKRDRRVILVQYVLKNKKLEYFLLLFTVQLL